MNSNTIAKFHLFGKVGKIVMTVLSVIAALITVSCCIATAFTATLPEDALTVRVVEHAEFRFNKASFVLGGSFTYSGKEFPEYMLEDSEKKANPPENQEFQAELKIFNQSYASAEIHSDESAKVMEADTSPEEYNVKDLVTVFIFLTLFSASATAALWMLRRLFAVLTRCESPFCCEVVNRMRGFGFSLLPAAVFASIGVTMLGSFLTAGKSTNVSIQWGVLIAFVVTMALVAVFKYGVQLQKESDETL